MRAVTAHAAAVSWAGFPTRLGAHEKPAPAFDALDLSSDDDNKFGRRTAEAAGRGIRRPAPGRGARG